MSENRTETNFFAGDFVDRRSEERTVPDWHVAVRESADTRFLLAQGTKQLMLECEVREIAFLDCSHPLVRAAAPEEMVLLGWFRGMRCVLVETQAAEPNLLPQHAQFEELRPLASVLSMENAALLAYARALSVWRARARYCGVCGSPTSPRSAGHVLRCLNAHCGEEFFPRLDPAIIVLVTDGERALLGRQASWPAGRYSTLAGFVEPGESLEDAVVREVLEETGVKAHHPRYQSSQPWPFPSSLMLGFEACASSDTEIRLDGELEDARWFDPTELADERLLPGAQSISRRLILNWLARVKA